MIRSELNNADREKLRELQKQLESQGYTKESGNYIDLESIVLNSLHVWNSLGVELEKEIPVPETIANVRKNLKDAFAQSMKTKSTPEGSFTPTTISNIIQSERTKTPVKLQVEKPVVEDSF